MRMAERFYLFCGLIYSDSPEVLSYCYKRLKGRGYKSVESEKSYFQMLIDNKPYYSQFKGRKTKDGKK